MAKKTPAALSNIQFETGTLSDPDFLRGLDNMAQEMREAAEREFERERNIVEASLGVSLTLTAGFVTWVLRAGSMLTSMMSVIPLWKQFDPLPVLAAAERRPDEKEAVRTVSTADDKKVETMFDSR